MKKFECDNCFELFDTTDEVDEHILDEHGGSTEVEVCDECEERLDECICEEEEEEEEEDSEDEDEE